MSPILFHVLPFLLLGLSVCFVDENSLAGYRYSSAMPMMGMVQLAYDYWDAALRMSMVIGFTRLSPSLPVLSLLYLLQPAPVSALLTSLPDGTPCGSCMVGADFQLDDIYNKCSDWASFITSCPQNCTAETPPDFTHPFPLGDGKVRECGSRPDFKCIHACAEIGGVTNEVLLEGCCFGKDSVVGHIHCFFLYHWYLHNIQPALDSAHLHTTHTHTHTHTHTYTYAFSKPPVVYPPQLGR